MEHGFPRTCPGPSESSARQIFRRSGYSTHLNGAGSISWVEILGRLAVRLGALVPQALCRCRRCSWLPPSSPCICHRVSFVRPGGEGCRHAARAAGPSSHRAAFRPCLAAPGLEDASGPLAISGPAVLVGHAYAGAVIAATRNEKVKALVYVSGLAPDEGETVADVFYRGEASSAGAKVGAGQSWADLLRTRHSPRRSHRMPRLMN